MKRVLCIGMALALCAAAPVESFAQNWQRGNRGGGRPVGSGNTSNSTANDVATGVGLGLGALAVGAALLNGGGGHRHHDGHRGDGYRGGGEYGYRGDGYRGGGYGHRNHGGYGAYGGGYNGGGYHNSYVRGGTGPSRPLRDWEVPRPGSGRITQAPASYAASEGWTGCRNWTNRFREPFQRCCSIRGGIRSCYDHY